MTVVTPLVGIDVVRTVPIQWQAGRILVVLFIYVILSVGHLYKEDAMDHS